MPADEIGSSESAELRITWAARTTRGKVRQVNEDAFLATDGMFVVADGMGGHAAGDVASSLVIEVCREFAAVVPLPLLRLEELVAEANARVRSHDGDPSSIGMGSTLVGVMLASNGGEDSLVVVNVGDSRCYRWDATAGLQCVTRDHSAVQDLVDAGTISAEQAASHPERNVVTRAIGVEAAVAADFVVLDRADTFRLLLCTDGVSGPIADARLGDVLNDCTSPEEAVDVLIDEVMAGAASDNATALVLDVEWVRSADGPGITDVTGPRQLDPADTVDEITAPHPLPRTTDSPTPAGLIDSVPFASPDAEGSDNEGRPGPATLPVVEGVPLS